MEKQETSFCELGCSLSELVEPADSGGSEDEEISVFNLSVMVVNSEVSLRDCCLIFQSLNSSCITTANGRKRENGYSGASAVLTLRRSELLLNYNYNHEKPSKAKRDVEKLVEDLELVLLSSHLHDSDGPNKCKRYSGR